MICCISRPRVTIKGHDLCAITMSADPRISAAQLKAARAFLSLTAQELADGCGVGVATIRRAETGQAEVEMSAATQAKVLDFLRSRGVVLTWLAGGGEGVTYIPVRQLSR